MTCLMAADAVSIPRIHNRFEKHFFSTFATLISFVYTDRLLYHIERLIRAHCKGSTHTNNIRSLH